MTDIDVIKTAVIKMLNESDAEDQSMHMGEIGSRLVKRYPDFDVRNYGDTKLSKFLRKFDLLEIRTRGKDGKNMWVSLKPEKPEPAQSTPKSSSPPQRRGRRPGRKK